MKSFMILWAIIAFLLGVGLSLENNCQWSTAFWRGCAAALVAAFLGRWWGNVWLDSLRDSIKQRRYKQAIPVTKPKTTGKT
jgi:hypothetical protein